MENIISKAEGRPETTSRPRSVERELPKAILHDDLDTVKFLYADLLDLQNEDKWAANALCLACKFDRLEIAKFLLESGVQPDGPDKFRDGRTPLMFSASEDIVNVLLGYGADVDACDESGRTALMFAKNIRVAEALLAAGADIVRKDRTGQTVLMHTITFEPSGHVAMLLIRHGADVNACDFRGQSVLMSAALRGQIALVREMLRHDVHIRQRDQSGRNILHIVCQSQEIAAICRKAHETASYLANVDVLDQLLENSGPDMLTSGDEHGRTPLHLAVGSNNPTFVKRLLESDWVDRANVNARADAGFCPLHVAAGSEHNTSRVTRLLLRHKADINAETEKGRSALHLASRSGNIEIVDLLLREPDLNVRRKDQSGETPLMSAATAGHSDIVALLSDHNSEELTEAQLEVSSEYFASIVDFTFDDRRKTAKSQKSNLRSRQTVAVKSLLTGDFPVRPRQASKAAKRAKSERQSFRWIHLPANNVVWCKDILLKWYVEGNSTDTDDFKRLQQSFNREHSGQEVHSHYMRPVCETVTSEIAPDVNLEGDEGSLTVPESKGQPATDPSLDLVVKESGERFTTLRMMYPFMPYVHWDSLHHQELRQRAVDMIKRTISTLNPDENMLQSMRRRRTWLPRDGEDMASSTEEALILAHAGIKMQTLHIRRTLDQFLSPSSRTWPNPDQDQVIVRHQRDSEPYEKDPDLLRKPGIDDKDTNLLMVDQLWIWIVSDDLIITSFPQQWQDRSRSPYAHGVFANIMEDLDNSNTESRRVSDVYDLAVTITRHCFATYETPAFGKLSYLDVFEITVQKVMEGEKKVSAAFILASMEASNWLNNPGSPKPQSVRQNLLDIVTGSQGLLQEIRDVRDELDTLRTLFGQQKNVLNDMGQQILHNLSRSKHSIVYRKKLEASIRDQDLRSSNLLADIQYLDEQADRISQSIKDLLDLKESFVNALQVADTSNQNQALMVFTIVTVIFSPLSFLTSFFALNVKEFPHDAQGNTEYPLGYVKKYVIGVGLAFALPCVIYALTLNRLSYLGRKWTNSCLELFEDTTKFFKPKTPKTPSEESSLEAGSTENFDWRSPRPTRPANESSSSISSSAAPITATGAAAATNAQSENVDLDGDSNYPPRPAQAVHSSRPPRTFSHLDMMRPNWAEMEMEMKERSERTRPTRK